MSASNVTVTPMNNFYKVIYGAKKTHRRRDCVIPMLCTIGLKGGDDVYGCGIYQKTDNRPAIKAWDF